MRKGLLVILCCILFLSCNNNGNIWPDTSTEDHFTFSVAEMTVDVTMETLSFDLIGKEAIETERETVTTIEVDEELSTAFRNRHYRLPDSFVYRFPAHSTEEQALSITLIPDNITSELVLIFNVVERFDSKGNPVIPDENLIRKITVRLIPVP